MHMMDYSQICICIDNNQSGTKPNLVAKIWPPNLVAICAWLPKLVANISSQFHRLVNTGLTVGSLGKWLPIKVPNTSKTYLSGSLLADWKWLHPIVSNLNTLCLVEFYIQWCGALKWTRWCSYLKQLICSCLASYFSVKATKVGSPPHFPKLISQLWGTLQPQYFVTLFLDPYWTYLWKYYIYYKKETKLVANILATKFGFVPDW